MMVALATKSPNNQCRPTLDMPLLNQAFTFLKHHDRWCKWHFYVTPNDEAVKINAIPCTSMRALVLELCFTLQQELFKQLFGYGNKIHRCKACCFCQSPSNFSRHTVNLHSSPFQLPESHLQLLLIHGCLSLLMTSHGMQVPSQGLVLLVWRPNHHFAN